MDPNTAFAYLSEKVQDVFKLQDACPPNGRPTDEQLRAAYYLALEMADLFSGLSQWVARGGVLPKAWQKGR